jgi:hypothetical protein
MRGSVEATNGKIFTARGAVYSARGFVDAMRRLSDTTRGFDRTTRGKNYNSTRIACWRSTYSAAALAQMDVRFTVPTLLTCRVLQWSGCAVCWRRS